MENMEIWNALGTTPKEAQKAISAGRLKGFTDINPMWRLKALTERFGPVGFGWRYEIVRTWLETGMQNEVRAFCQIDLYVKVGNEWSAPIPGIGGSSFVTVERSGPYCSDECFKMALTDAISVSCKALGMSADVYYAKDCDKYTAAQGATSAANQESAVKAPGTVPGAGAQRTVPGAPVPSDPASNGQINLSGRPPCMRCGREIERDAVVQYSMKHYGQALCYDCQQKAKRRVTA